MIRKLLVAQTKVSKFGWRPLLRRMCSADGGSAATARFLSTATKGFVQLKAFLAILSFSGGGYCLCQSQDWRRKIEGKIDEHSEPVRRIVNSQVRPSSSDDYIPRTDLSDKLKAAVFSTREGVEDDYISITGNLEVGKSRLVRHVLTGRSGVLEVYMGNHETPEKALCSALGVANIFAVERALVEAERQLGQKPVIVLHVHERVNDPQVIRELSWFAHFVGRDRKLAKLIVVFCAAATTVGFHGRRFKSDFFVPEFTREDLDSADARRAFGIWYGEPVQDSDVDRIFDLVGGRIGNIQDILVFGRKGGLMGSLDKALASMEQRLSEHVWQYQTIDTYGGFGGRREVRLASWLAHEVARVPFEQCLARERFPLYPTEFGETVRDSHADAIYFNPEVKGYCARSPFVHRQLGSIPFQPKSLRKPP